MSFQLTPSVGQEPSRSQTGGVTGRVEPVRDATAGTLLAIGGGLQDLGQATTSAAAVYQGEVDKAQSLRHRNLFATEADSVLQDPESGFLTTVGANANADRRKQAFDRLKAKRKSIEALAQNDMQRANFAEYADRIEAEAGTQADVHQTRQVRTFRAGETKVSADRGIQRAIQFVGTDEGEIAKMEAMRDLDTAADLYGWPKDSAQRAKLKQDAVDDLHAGVIDQYTQDPQGAPIAAVYLSQHRGEMSPSALSKSVDDVRRAMKIGHQEQVDAAAWDGANRLAETGLSIDQQRADIDRGVRMGIINAEVATKMLSLAENFDNNKWQGLQRERSQTLQEAEQSFATDPTLEVEMMPAATLDAIDRLGLRSDVVKKHTTVRLNRLADQVGEGSIDSLVLSRDMRSVGEMRQMVTFLEERIPQGNASQTPDGKAKKKRLGDLIKTIEAQVEAILTRPRTYVVADDLTAPMPNNPQQPQQIDMNQFAESVRKALYPGSGR